MITFPNAKINLGLNITERRPDGYHNLETVFYPIPLQDALEVTVRGARPEAPAPDVLPTGCRTETVVTDDYTLRVAGTPVEGSAEQNLVVKAYRLLQREHALPPLNIYMYKHIPTGAGLGGGSADAAFMMKLLNDKFALGLSADELEAKVATLGADCAFFVRNTPVFATGIGNVFTPVTCSLAGWYLVLVKPDVFVSTKEAYACVHPRRPERSPADIVRQPVETWREALTNDFEESLFPAHPEIAAIKDKLYDLGAAYAAMSGSGSSVFGLFRRPVEHVEEVFEGHFCRQRLLP